MLAPDEATITEYIQDLANWLTPESLALELDGMSYYKITRYIRSCRQAQTPNMHLWYKCLGRQQYMNKKTFGLHMAGII